MPDTLFHVSDIPDIARFEPRPVAPVSVTLLTPEGAVVWAVDEAHLQNYLLPRDCPRVTFYALPDSTPADIERLLGQTTAKYVVAIESRWLKAVASQRLYQYELSGQTFTVIDAGAGYYVSREPVTPRTVRPIDDLLEELLTRDVELRVMPSLWRLRDAVVPSTLQFSIIRMRNALPRDSERWR